MARIGTGRPMSADERRFRAEHDLSTLRGAEEIKADRQRLDAAQKIAREQMSALVKVTGKPVGGPAKGGSAKGAGSAKASAKGAGSAKAGPSRRDQGMRGRRGR